MRVEIRNDAVVIDGYVNAVERESKVLRDRKGQFIEKIKAGVFQRALERAKEVKVLLNHNYDRELTSTKESTTTLVEDAIGLRCRCEIRDAEVVEKAKKGKLVGWSFGFICLKEERTESTDAGMLIDHREVRELDLKEVSILDDTKTPAYNATTIETREEEIEIRVLFDDNLEVSDKTFDNHEFENRYYATFIR